MSAVEDQAIEPLLRPMRPEDVEQIMAIETLEYRFPWTAGIFRDCLQVGYCCWVLERLGTIVAYGLMSKGAGEAHVLNLCVRAEDRRKGYGRRLLAHLLHLARRHEAETVFLEVRPTNQGALRLYTRMGFSEVGRRRAYYPADDGREDAIILAMTLSPGMVFPGTRYTTCG